MIVDRLIMATPDLLDGWCGPVVDTNGCTHALLGRSRAHPYGAHRGLQWASTKVDGWGTEDGEIDGGGYWLSPAGCQLDLGRSECRDRLDRVMATRLGTDDRDFRADEHAADPEDEYHCCCWLGEELFQPHPDEGGHRDTFGRVVPGLAELDFGDAVTLPDGSPRVLALARAIIWRSL